MILFVVQPAALQSLSAKIGLLSAVLAALLAAVGLIQLVRASVRDGSTTAGRGDLTDVLEKLAAQVRYKWDMDRTDRLLNSPRPMPVHWSFVEPDVMENDFLSGQTRPVISGRSDQISLLLQEFRRLSPRRLVILGGPGSGKTTLAIQLLLALLESSQPGEPVPVLVSLSGWNTKVHSRLDKLLAARLEEMYPVLREGTFSSRLVEELLKRSMILPVLDGLDELTDEARVEVILALNRSLKENDQLILTSRTEDYTEALGRAGHFLEGAVSIESRPLQPEEIAQYIEACLARVPRASSQQQSINDSWQAVLTALRTGKPSPLLSVASRPISLWLLRIVFIEPRPESRPDPRSLLDAGVYPDESAMLIYLYEKLIPALIESRDPSSEADDLFRPRNPWNPEKAGRWLGYLAFCLERDRQARASTPTPAPRTDLCWWNLTKYALTTAQVLLSFGAACALAVCLTVMFGSSGGIASQMHGGVSFGITGGLIVGAGSGAALWLAFSDSGARWLDYPNPAPAEKWLRDLLRRHFIGGLAMGSLFGLVGGCLIGVIEGVAAGLTFGIVSGLTFGLSGGFTFGAVGEVVFRVASWADRQAAASTPQSTLRSDRTLTLWSALIITAAYGVTFGVAVGLAFGLANFLSGGLAGRESHSWATYLFASMYSATKRKLPIRLMSFLDDADRVGLLRTVGPRYQFRHDGLQRYLADTYQVKH